MRRSIYCILIAVGTLLAGCTESQGRFNPASLETEPLVPSLASTEVALTFAQVQADDGQTDTLLVTAVAGETIEGVTLHDLGGVRAADIFDAVRSVPKMDLLAASGGNAPRVTVRIDALLPSGGTARRHVASGTNFPEHAVEADSNMVFNFPKFGAATPARTTVTYRDDVLLDYEVEICVRFDRDIRTLADFDAALQGFFLCGDFTDRAELLRLVDTDNFDSGSGFSDAKSGSDFFPTGPFIVIPADWRSFVASERILTTINGTITQDARGGEMTLDFRELTAKVLNDVTSERFIYQGEHHRLVETPMIPRGTVLMSGTAEGVLMRAPTIGEIAAGAFDHIRTGAFATEQTGFESVVEHFIEGELASGRYLQRGETVRYAGSRLGTIRIEVI